MYCFVLRKLCDLAQSTILKLIQYSFPNCKNNAVDKTRSYSLQDKVCEMSKMCFICSTSLSSFNFLDKNFYASHPIFLVGSLIN